MTKDEEIALLRDLVGLYDRNTDIDDFDILVSDAIEELRDRLGLDEEVEETDLGVTIHPFSVDEPYDAAFVTNDCNTQVRVKKVEDGYKRVQSSYYRGINWPKEWSRNTWDSIEEAATIGYTLEVKKA